MNRLICGQCVTLRRMPKSNEVCEHLQAAVSRLIEGVPPGGVTDGQTWVLVLDKYHRDNLLKLLNAVGYPAPSRHADGRVDYANPHLDPDLRRYSTGDWNGEIPLMLANLDGSIVAAENEGNPLLLGPRAKV